MADFRCQRRDDSGDSTDQMYCHVGFRTVIKPLVAHQRISSPQRVGTVHPVDGRSRIVPKISLQFKK